MSLLYDTLKQQENMRHGTVRNGYVQFIANHSAISIVMKAEKHNAEKENQWIEIEHMTSSLPSSTPSY